jgi:hypothetical protein
MLGRSFKDELQEVLEYMLEDNIAGADGRRADIIDGSSCVCWETGEEGEKKSMNDCWSSLARFCSEGRSGISIGDMGGKWGNEDA